jgi:hypothetical protein
LLIFEIIYKSKKVREEMPMEDEIIAEKDKIIEEQKNRRVETIL